MEDIGDWRAGSTPPKGEPRYYANGDIPWVLVGDLNDAHVSKITKRITNAAIEERPLRINPVGSVLVAMYMSIGKCGILDIPAATNQAICACIPFDNALSTWLHSWILSQRMGLTKMGSGSTQLNISREKLTGYLIAIPPLAEQRRIVAKVDELMPLVEEYGRLEDARTSLDASLPDRLRKSVLQLAVEGKLVEQDANDEPANVLLERIREERTRLIKEKKIKAPKGSESVVYRASDGGHYEKRGKSEPVCIDDEIPFEIPESWEWVRFESLLFNRDAERIPVSVSDREKLAKIYDYYGASGVIDKVDKYLFDKPLLLIGEDGANLISRSTPIAFMARGKYWVNNHAHVLDGISETLLEYVSLYINAISLAPYVTGTAQPKMNQKMMGSILVPVPPEKEQQRIVLAVQRIITAVTNL